MLLGEGIEERVPRRQITKLFLGLIGSSSIPSSKGVVFYKYG